ncbi:MAG: hypothetical protein AB7I27_18085 [Bacteriovoracaceae bacterium]
MKLSLYLGLTISSMFIAASSGAAVCEETYVSNEKIVKMIEADLGQGSAQYCSKKNFYGVSNPYIFYTINCNFGNRNVVRYVVGEESGGWFDEDKTKCTVSIKSDSFFAF